MNAVLEPHDVMISTLRWALGLSLGASAGLLLAVLVHLVGPLRGFALGITSFLRALPILALVPVFAWLIGLKEDSKILLIAWACFFPVFISTIRAVGRQIDDLELRMRANRFSPLRSFRHYQVPRLLFGFLAGVEISVGIGWLTVVAAEMLATHHDGFFRGGLGDALSTAFGNSNHVLGLICLGIFGLLGLLSAGAWTLLARAIVKLSGYDRAALVSK